MNAREFLKKRALNEGQLVKLSDGEKSFVGYVLPLAGSGTGILRLKLKSGYNVGIAVSERFSAQKLGPAKKFGGQEKARVKQDATLPKIAILHTGGTIASRVDYRTGGAYSAFEPEDLLTMFPELLRIGNFSSKLVANMWSDDLRFEHIGILADEAKAAYEKGASGVIIGMGTDNMAVASAALAFAIEQCPIPVIFLGAQRSSDRGSSDAAMNLICASEFIAKTDFAGVAICMHNSSSDDKCAILPACKTRKMHSSRRDAFKAVNGTPIALVDFETREIEFMKKDYARRGGELTIKPKFEPRVALFKISINMFPEQFEFYYNGKFRGVVIEGTGLGHTPGHNPNEYTKIHEKIFPAIKKLVDSGCVVVMTTNTLYGRVHMHVYDKAIDLANLGVVAGEDMLPETAFVKLAWLLGNYRAEEAKGLVGRNLRGEISPFTKY